MSTNRIQNFLVLVNDRLLGSKQLSQLTALWDEAHQYPKCQTLVLKGERQGQVCGKACIKDKHTCMCHAPRPPKKEKPVEHRDRCSVVAKKGQCKRFVVDGDTCKVHHPKDIVLCSFVLKSGDRKATNCGKACSKENTLCPRHTKDTTDSVTEAPKPSPVTEAPKTSPELIPSTVVDTCDWMMKSGAKKGQLCGKKCVAEKKQCVLHV